MIYESAEKMSIQESAKVERPNVDLQSQRKPKGRPLTAVGVFDSEGPPVPIPNTEVKLVCAYNTWLEAARDDWSMPTQNPETGERKQLQKCGCFFYAALCAVSRFMPGAKEEKIAKRGKNLQKGLDNGRTMCYACFRSYPSKRITVFVSRRK